MPSTFATFPSAAAKRPPIRLAFGLLFWRLMAGLMLLFSLVVGLAVLRLAPPGQRVIVFLIHMPGFAAVAFFLAATGTVLVDLAVRFIVRPRMLSWLAPRADDSHSAFHLEARERPLAETPARMARGRSWAPGRLMLTDRRLLFLPAAWDVEPWSAPRDRVQGARLSAPPRAFWGLVRGLPPRLEVAADGRSYLFALLDAPAWSRLVLGKALDPAEPLSK
jgi:hypothetical protein